jgi:hypothetical protein
MHDGYRHIRRWTMPRHYSGAIWEGYWVATVGRSRDSDSVEESNWRMQLRAIGPEDGETVVVVRESHFLCGWVEWLAIREDAGEKLAEADRIGERLQQYPILDEWDHDWVMVERGEVECDD